MTLTDGDELPYLTNTGTPTPSIIAQLRHGSNSEIKTVMLITLNIFAVNSAKTSFAFLDDHTHRKELLMTKVMKVYAFFLLIFFINEVICNIMLYML